MVQGYHGQWKVREKRFFFKVREKLVNFVLGQGNLEFCTKSGKSQGILYHFGFFRKKLFLFIYCQFQLLLKFFFSLFGEWLQARWIRKFSGTSVPQSFKQLDLFASSALLLRRVWGKHWHDNLGWTCRWNRDFGARTAH